MDLQRVLSALIKTAERATRLLAIGEGLDSGRKHKWLEKSVDFVITGLTPGSTILEIEAPCFADTAKDIFAQTDFWRKSPTPEDTAIDLAAQAIMEAQSDNPAGDCFDASVLESILDLSRAVHSPGVSYELHSVGRAGLKVVLEGDASQGISEKLKKLPVSRAFITNGKLDEIRHSGGRFRLILNNGLQLLGRVHPEYLDGEMLRPLWGKSATVEGIVHFKANGQPRLIEARRICEYVEGDMVFAEAPAAYASKQQTTMFPPQMDATSKTDPMNLWGAWPGDEPIEELLEQLD